MTATGLSMDESAEARADDRAPALRERSPAEAEARLRRIVDMYFDFIWRSLRRLGVPGTLVDDAAQRVFLVTSNNLSRIAPDKERSYLFGTAVRVASDMRRVRARLRELGGDDHVEAAVHPMPSPDELVDQKRAREMLDALLDTMPIELRTVLLLVEGEGLTGPEIAALLDIPLGTVNSRLRRAREELTRAVARLTQRAKTHERGSKS